MLVAIISVFDKFMIPLESLFRKALPSPRLGTSFPCFIINKLQALKY